MVAVPEVPESREVADAVKALEEAKLKAEKGKEENSETVAKGLVIRFDPRSQQNVPEGSVVKYIVSLGAGAVTVPATEGKSQADATAILKAEGLTVSGTKTVNSARIPVDMVVGTDPPVDSTVAYGQEVVLLISNGNTTVPDCAGKTLADCSKLLSDSGLVMGEQSYEESDQTPDTVLRTDPAKDATAPQGTSVKVVVARAAETVTLPDLTNRNASEARSWLDGAGLMIEEVRETSTQVKEGVVLRTEPGANTAVKKGSTVRLIVSSGPGPQDPSPEPS
ncbi:MAG: PASTA domain-containing protein [Bifidobacteriaceae bacterium]|jgi:serine/threonine-protein kinase|nr:PASTA domain-containing protein [Bifidobacteriaceae bacterium]